MTRKLEPEPLPPGAWRLDPFTRVLRYVFDNPEATVPDAFDEPLEIEGAPARPSQPIAHGTYKGSRAHYRRGEKPCPDCRRAETDHRNKRAAIRYANGDPKFTCECGAFKHRASASCARCAATIRYSTTESRAA